MAGSLARAAPPRVAPRATPAPSVARRSRRSAQAPTSSSSTSLRARAKPGGDDADGATSRAEDAQLWIDAWRETLRDATTASASEARAERESDDALSETARASSAVHDETTSSRRAKADVAKTALMRAARLTDRGLRVESAEARAALNERVSALEATYTRGDDDDDDDDDENADASLGLVGAWRLVYTDALETLAALRVVDATPGVTAGRLTQTIAVKQKTKDDPNGVKDDVRRIRAPPSPVLVARTVLEVSAPLVNASAFVSSELSFATPRRAQTRTTKAGLEKCEVVDTVSQYVSPPVSVRVLGVDVDTSAAADLIADPARLFVKDAVAALGDAVARTAAALKGADEETGLSKIVAAPVPSSFPGAHAWMLTTYVDEDTRVARGEGGSVYLFEKIR
jgi:hypothetical protein